jgi:hypothetical protein
MLATLRDMLPIVRTIAVFRALVLGAMGSVAQIS